MQSYLTIAAVALVCAVLGAGAILAFVRRILPSVNELVGLRQTKADLERDLAVERLETAHLRERLEQERQQAGEKLKLFSEMLEPQFKVISNDLMTRHGEIFSKQNKEQLDVVLTPLREKLGEFEKGLQTAQTESTKERTTLAEQIRQLSEKSAIMTSETANLTRALKGETQTQGAWGEMILGSLLAKSGLREGEEYEVQSSHTMADGRRMRPDVIINLPGGQRVIIDSKVSLVAFERYINATADEERSTSLDDHVASMRSQIKILASKEYQTIDPDGLDYVIMFVPIEGALAVALQKDPNLTSYAVQNNVAIATPTTLMIILRTIENVWKVERRNRNADQIAERAGHLYNKFVSFVSDLQSLGQRLHQAQFAFDGAMSKLQTGSGNLIGQAQKLKDLGAKTAKSLPESVFFEPEATADSGESSLPPGSLALTQVDQQGQSLPIVAE